jgi:hypothetical protein
MGIGVDRFQKPQGQFEAEITADEIDPKGKFGEQYFIEVKPVNPDREPLRNWFKIPKDQKTGATRMSGQLAEVFEGLTSVFAGQITEIGAGQLVGKRAIFEYRTSTYKDPRGTEQTRSRDSLVAVAPAPVAAAAKAGK